MSQSKLEANACRRCEARENSYEQFTIGFGFNPDWLRKWREFYKPITKRSTTKPKQTGITFNTQVEIALIVVTVKPIYYRNERDKEDCQYYIVYY